MSAGDPQDLGLLVLESGLRSRGNLRLLFSGSETMQRPWDDTQRRQVDAAVRLSDTLGLLLLGWSTAVDRGDQWRLLRRPRRLLSVGALKTRRIRMFA